MIEILMSLGLMVLKILSLYIDMVCSIAGFYFITASLDKKAGREFINPVDIPIFKYSFYACIALFIVVYKLSNV